MRILHRLGRAIHRAGKLVRDSCAGQCCGACSRVYRFVHCCDALSQTPREVFVCSDATCGGQPMANIFRIIYGGECYSRPVDSPTYGASGNLNIVDGADLDACDHGGCSSPECIDLCGNRFIPGQVCPGQNPLGFTVYAPAAAVVECGVLNILGVCMHFDPANSIPESELPANPVISGLVQLPAGHTHPKICCACVSGCSETVQTVTECSGAGPVDVERRCCCTPRRDVNITFTSSVTYNPALSFVLTRTISGSALVQYDDGNQVINTVGGIATVTETYAVGPSQTFDIPFTPAGECLPVPLDPYLGAFRPFPWILDCTFTNNDGENTSQTFTNIVRTCTNGLHTGAWSLLRNVTPGDPLSGQVIASGSYTSSIAVVFFGRCSGGCPGGEGRAGIIAARGSAGCSGCGDKGTGGATI